MKKNGLQVISLVLNVALLVGLVLVRSEMKELRREAADRHHQLYNEIDILRERVNSIRTAQREQTEFVEEFSFESTGLNEETKMLEGEMTLSLRRWAADTAVTLLAELNGETWEFPMAGENAVFKTTVGLPVTEHGELVFAALITSQGETSREHVTGWENISMLLPLQYRGGGFDGPVYQQGILSSQFHITLQGQDQSSGDITKPRFLIYQNGKLVQELDAVIDPGASASNGVCYTVDAEDYCWSLECMPGDTVEIRFLCRDEYGLGYDFYFQGWIVGADGEVEEYYTEGESLVLLWD